MSATRKRAADRDRAVLDELLACAARGQLTASEGADLTEAVGELREQLAHARRVAGGLQGRVDRDLRKLIALQADRDRLESQLGRYRAAWRSARRRAPRLRPTPVRARARLDELDESSSQPHGRYYGSCRS